MATAFSFCFFFPTTLFLTRSATLTSSTPSPDHVTSVGLRWEHEALIIGLFKLGPLDLQEAGRSLHYFIGPNAQCVLKDDLHKYLIIYDYNFWSTVHWKLQTLKLYTATFRWSFQCPRGCLKAVHGLTCRKKPWFSWKTPTTSCFPLATRDTQQKLWQASSRQLWFFLTAAFFAKGLDFLTNLSLLYCVEKLFFLKR